MTALFACVRQGSALLGADSKRTDPLGFFVIPPVTKAYAWGNAVLFAGTGNGPNLERLAKVMLSDLGVLGGDESGFLAAFAKHQPGEYLAAVSRQNLPGAAAWITGTFLVAVCATVRRNAHLLRLDYKTGAVTSSRARLMADGTNPNKFKQIARREIARYQNQPLPGDVWLGTCMDQAIAVCPQDVDWPMDILVAHPTAHSLPGVSSISLRGPSLLPDGRFIL